MAIKKLGIIFLSTCALVSGTSELNAEHRVGGDISLLPEYEEAGAIYRDHNGKQINDVLPFFKEEGMNAMRVRLFVDPAAYKGADKDPNACQSLDYIIPLCKKIRDTGFDLMLNFHYSDSWADPAKQTTPAAWANLTDEELYVKIYEYTKETLRTLRNEGIIPAFIQPGNEISYGMLWGPEGTPDNQKKTCYINSSANWDRFGKLLNQAIKACREECPQAKIVLHTERVGQPNVQKNFYTKMEQMQVDYDIIGLSYYPYFHGTMTVLETALKSLDENFPTKEIMIVETGFPYKWEVPGTSLKVEYEYSDAGQDAFAKALVSTLEAHPSVTGLFWWWMEYNAYKTSLSGWYNAPLFDSTTGMATSALKTICSFATDSNHVSEINVDPSQNEKWYDLCGREVRTPLEGGIYISKGKKVLKIR